MNRARNFSNLPMAEAPQRPYKDWLWHACSRPSGAFKRLAEAFQRPTVAFQRLAEAF